jgi:hypothetical protein
LRVRAARICVVTLLALELALAPGCLFVAGAAVGAGVIVAAGEDGAEIRFDEDRDIVWDAAYAVADDWGVITSVDRDRGTLEAKEGDTTVTADVVHLESGAVRVRFRARKLGATIPDRERAEILAENLARRLAKS